MSNILIVEDEKHLAEGLRFNLEADGYSVDVVTDGEAAGKVLLADRRKYSAVILDVMLPGKDGFTVAAELRQAGQFVPILMLTARGRPEDVLRGFEAGADDYLPKPFELKILLARLRGLLRRNRWMRIDQEQAGAPDEQKNAEEVYLFAGRALDFRSQELRVEDAGKTRAIQLTLMEARLLRYLIERDGRVAARKEMLEAVWGLRDDTDTRAIDNFIVRLRKYIEPDPARPRHLLTVRGIGYRFVMKPEMEPDDAG
ncbi:MAG: response regulator transcription factor [Blastocatellia bacterium]